MEAWREAYLTRPADRDNSGLFAQLVEKLFRQPAGEWDNIYSSHYCYYCYDCNMYNSQQPEHGLDLGLGGDVVGQLGLVEGAASVVDQGPVYRGSWVVLPGNCNF